MFIPQSTADGSFTFFSSQFGEAFHSHHGAHQEAQFKFVEPTGLRQKALKPKLRLLDVCYGLGYNTAAALATIWAINPSCDVEVVGLELNPSVPLAAIAHRLLNIWSQPIPQLLTHLATTYQARTDHFKANLLIGDARVTIRQVQDWNFQADAIFLDPFSPPNCPQMWTVEFLEHVSSCLCSNGRLATYSCAASVRTALMAAGLQIGSTLPVGRRSPGTVASWSMSDLPVLSQQQQEYLLTRAAIPYRDPQLVDSNTVILQRRQREQHASSLEPTSRWMKRTRAMSKQNSLDGGRDNERSQNSAIQKSERS